MILTPFIISCLAGAAGTIIFLVLSQSIVGGIQFYKHSYIQHLGLGLKESFVLLDSKTLLAMNVSLILLLGVLGYLFMGFWGMLALIIFAAIFPRFFVKQLRKRHSKIFVHQLPDCLSSIASSLKSGASLIRSMEIAIQEQTPPISKEFAVILSEYKMGRKLEESFDDLYKRISRPEVELLNSAISISRAVGGDLADTIESLADTLRERAKVQNKINALTAMGKMQGWVSCLIPGLVALALFKQEPEAMEVLISEPIGWITLAVISVMMLGAIFVINKIVDIDI